MKMHTPDIFQNRMVQHSYGWHDGTLYRRTLDTNDRSETWAQATDADAAQAWDGWTVPTGCRWAPCQKPEGALAEWVDGSHWLPIAEKPEGAV